MDALKLISQSSLKADCPKLLVGDYVRVRITGCSSATLFGEEVK